MQVTIQKLYEIIGEQTVLARVQQDQLNAYATEIKRLSSSQTDSSSSGIQQADSASKEEKA